MKQLSLLFVLFVLCIAQQEWVQEYTAFASKEIKDLDGWVIQNKFKGDAINKCGDVSIVGGFNAFGRRATATKQIRIPPHFKLKFQVQLWKIDSWDNEKMQIYIDGFLWEARWGFSDGGTELCGAGGNGYGEKVYDIEFLVTHNSPQATIIMTSTLDEEADNESWGFRNVKVSFLPCPAECGICHSNKPNECFFWQQVDLSWVKQDVAIEGWTLKNGNARSSECSGINIFGGFGNIGKASTLAKQFTNLPPHYEIMLKFQFWKIDSWDNEEFRLSIDNLQVFSQKFQWNEGVQLCGKDTGKNSAEQWAEKVENIEVRVPHENPAALVFMTSTLDEDLENESWGIRDYFLFVGRCSKYCTSCKGPGQSECTKCEETHQLVDGQCKDGVEWFVETKDFFGNDQIKELKGWEVKNVEGGASNPFSDCGQFKLVGGFMKFGKNAVAIKVFRLPKHKRVRVRVQLWKIDAWDGEELFVKLDENKIFNQNLGWNDPGQYNICGQKTNNWNERVINVDVALPHSKEEVKIELGSSLTKGASETSWGFREFMLLYEAEDDCIIFYSQCNFQGESYEFCKNTESFTKVRAQLTMPIQSIKIPPLTSLIGFSEENFKGGRVEFTESQECIKDYKFSFYQIETQIHQINLKDVPISSNLKRKQINI